MMGCKTYSCNGCLIHHDGGGSDCLCTFPHNWECADVPKLRNEDVKTMAYIGVLTLLSKRGLLKKDDYSYFPKDVPKWIKDEIDRIIPKEVR